MASAASGSRGVPSASLVEAELARALELATASGYDVRSVTLRVSIPPASDPWAGKPAVDVTVRGRPSS